METEVHISVMLSYCLCEPYIFLGFVAVLLEQ